MNIVITMAGMGSRFTKAGYTVPKYMIEAHDKSLFEWSMESLRGFNDENTKYIFIVRKEHNTKEFIINKMKNFNVYNVKVIEIDYLTEGQATTALLASKYWDKNEELLIYNIDTYIEAYVMKKDQLKGAGFIPCFKAEGDHWSFVKLNNEGQAIEIKEKVRISDNCTVGAYYFKTCGLYEQMYNEFYNNYAENSKEKYIAPLYNYMLSKGLDVFISVIPNDKVHVLGTPEELDIFLKQDF